MALLRTRLRSAWALLVAAGFVATSVYQPEVLRVEVFEARLCLLFVTSVWFAWSFYETDVLGVVAALVVFDGMVGFSAMLRMSLDLSVLPFLLVFALLALGPAFALLSLHHRRRATATTAAPGLGV